MTSVYAHAHEHTYRPVKREREGRGGRERARDGGRGTEREKEKKRERTRKIEYSHTCTHTHTTKCKDLLRNMNPATHFSMFLLHHTPLRTPQQVRRSICDSGRDIANFDALLAIFRCGFGYCAIPDAVLTLFVQREMMWIEHHL